MDLRIRRATTTDAAGLAELARLTFPLACPPNSAPEDIQDFIATQLSSERFADYLADHGRVLVVAEDDAGLCGYTMLVRGEPADPDVAAAITVRPTIELSKVYVLAGSHGRGVSAPLIAATLDAARSTDSAGIWLGVNQLNGRALRFYEKNGFSVVGEKTFQLGENFESDFVMERSL
ncbi:tRNA (guanine37-N1)-methyltransferase [Mycetocola sp. CAN_C7]|uniref:GNAT family N-acetyltransferase n=1 Tax=Mycetocola sp. CAN_C7 TaxID=2787724 RepID=UPI0018CB8132